MGLAGIPNSCMCFPNHGVACSILGKGDASLLLLQDDTFFKAQTEGNLFCFVCELYVFERFNRTNACTMDVVFLFADIHDPMSLMLALGSTKVKNISGLFDCLVPINAMCQVEH